MLRFKACFLFAVVVILLNSCKINRSEDGLRTGLWITNTGDGFESRGRYKKDKEKGTWKYFYNDTLYQKDRYSGNNARVKFYHSNSKISASGKTQIDFNGKLAHWYYNGDWKYFDIQGNLVRIITYKNGNPIAEVSSTNLFNETKTNQQNKRTN